MARARQGQHRWQRPEWGAPDRPSAAPRRWHVPLFGVLLLATAGWLWQHPEQLPDGLRQQVAEMAAEVSAPPKPDGPTQVVYRWRDGSGVVQFTDEPPPEGVVYVLVEVDPATNTLPAGAAPWSER